MTRCPQASTGYVSISKKLNTIFSTVDSFSIALITGSACGIGRVLAHTLVAAGRSVILCRRTEANLRTTFEEFSYMKLSGEFVLQLLTVKR